MTVSFITTTTTTPTPRCIETAVAPPAPPALCLQQQQQQAGFFKVAGDEGFLNGPRYFNSFFHHELFSLFFFLTLLMYIQTYLHRKRGSRCVLSSCHCHITPDHHHQTMNEAQDESRAPQQFFFHPLILLY